MTLEQSIKAEIKEVLTEKGTVSASWIKSNVRKFDFNFEEFAQVFPNAETLTLENGEIVVTLKAEKPAEKIVKVTGNIYAVKGILKQFGFKWDAEGKAWIGTVEQKESMLKAADAEKEVTSLTYEIE